MDRLRLRLDEASKTQSRLEEVLRLDVADEVVRDAAIKRFEFTFETTWKAAQAYLAEIEGIEAASPKGIIRQCHLLGLLDTFQTEQALAMADDRNLSSHTYREKLAKALISRLPGHLAVLSRWLEAMVQKAK